MDCGLTRSELVPFHFGECAPDLRAPLEQHLLACRECLTAYLELKRALESEPARAPSRLAHARLRAAVAAEIAHRAPRPAPVARRAPSRMGAAFAGAAAALLAVVAVRAARPAFTRSSESSVAPLSERAIDTARSPESTNSVL